MKIAFVHDYLKEIGGAERVLMALKEIWPEAPVYTAYKFPKYWGQYKETLEKWEVYESWGKGLPFLPKFISYYTILSPLFFTQMDLSAYDVVIISATGGYFPNGIKVGPKTKIITYCHTPPRFLYGYETATKARYKWYWRVPSHVANHILRMVDFKFAQRSNVFVANSRNVANRVRKFYRREAEVVYPPIGVKSEGTEATKKGDYFLIVSRIVGTKNIDLAVTAANKFGFKLKVAGRPIGAGGEEIVARIKGANVEYVGEVSEEKKQELLVEAKGFLALEKDADFGITTVEPMIVGTPVIAYKNGGYLEVVQEGVNGIFFEDLSMDGLGKAIEKFNKLKWDKKAIIKSVDKFSDDNFKKQMIKLVDKEYARIARD